MLESIFQDGKVLQMLGIASAVLSICAFVPYIRDILKGRTQPQRASWLIWSVLGSIALASQIYEGATQSLWFAAIQVGGTIAVLLLAITFGAGRFLLRGDIYVLMAAALGLVLWMLTDTAVYALSITITISLLGGVMTCKKAYRDPNSETLSKWVWAFFASVCAIGAVGQFDPVLMAYPAYVFILNGAIISSIHLGRARQMRVGVIAAE